MFKEKFHNYFDFKGTAFLFVLLVLAINLPFILDFTFQKDNTGTVADWAQVIVTGIVGFLAYQVNRSTLKLNKNTMEIQRLQKLHHEIERDQDVFLYFLKNTDMKLSELDSKLYKLSINNKYNDESINRVFRQLILLKLLVLARILTDSKLNSQAVQFATETFYKDSSTLKKVFSSYHSLLSILYSEQLIKKALEIFAQKVDEKTLEKEGILTKSIEELYDYYLVEPSVQDLLYESHKPVLTLEEALKWL